MAEEFKTLQFPNTPEGQAEKTTALAREAQQGWELVSETITAGDFNKEKACCFFLIFAPCAFLAGHQKGIITVTLRRSLDGDKKNTRAGLVASERIPNPPKLDAYPTSPAPVAMPKPDRTAFAEEFVKLAKLRDQGVLSESEFAEMKAALISDAKSRSVRATQIRCVACGTEYEGAAKFCTKCGTQRPIT